MSTTIDSRVVEMRFDNKHFENNVSNTMSTLDKLKQKLHLDGASKGLENVGSAAKKVDMSGLASGVETVQAKFSAMQVVGVTALANITNSAVNAGKRIVSALTIDPVKTGFQEYETQINAVQTILANTESKGTTIDDVNRALEELNEYADMTIYNFTEMTRNIGTFTAAGVDLDTSTNAIKGIANLAAVSGSTSQQASTAMYQLSQALSSGTVKLMDWNSVVNAGMGGQVFQDALKETARVHGVAIDDMIERQGSFRETLSEGWLTSEILTETLQKFTLATEGLNEAEIEANREMLRAKGYTDEQIEAIFKLGNTATNAATKVKTFTQLWDVLKESAQSGWSQTWKLIVGDFEEAKELLTPLADTLTGFINKMSDWRNRILQIALDFASPWTAMMDKIGSVGKVAEKVTTNLTDKLEYFQEVVSKVWRGDYRNSDTGRYELLEAAGYDHRVVQDLVNKGRDYKLTVEDIEASHKKFGLTMKTTTKETEDVTTAITELSDEQLKHAGLTEEEIRLYRALESEADRLGISVSELAEEMSNTNGRDMLIDSFKNIGSAILDMGNAIKSAWIEIFNPPSPEVLGIRLYGIIKSLKEFTKTLRLVDEKTGEFTETGEKFQRIFKGIFAAIDIVLTVVGGPLKIVFKAVTQLLGYFGVTVLDVAAFIGDAIVKFRDWIDSVLDFTKVFDKIVPPIKKAIEAFRTWIASLKDSKNLPKDIADGIISGLGKAAEFIGNLFSQIWTNLKNGFSGAPGDMVSGFVNGVWSGIKTVGKVIAELAAAALEKFREVLGIHSPSTETYEDGQNFIQGFWNGLKDSAGKVWNWLKEFGQKCLEVIRNIDFGAVITSIIGIGMVRGFNKIGEGIAGFGGFFENLGEGFGELLENVAKMANSFSKVLKSVALQNTAKAIKDFAIALAILVVALVALAYVCGKDDFNVWEAVGVIGALAVILGVLAGAMALISKSSVDIGKDGIKIGNLTSGLIGIGAALLLVAFTVKTIGSMDPETAKAGFDGLLKVILAMVSIMAACKILTTGDTASTIGKIGTTILKISIAMLLLVGVAKLVAGMSWKEMGKAAIGLGGLITIVSLLMLATRMVGPNADKIGKTILKISIAMLLLVGVAKIIAGMSWQEMGKAAAGLAGLVAIVSVLMLATRLAGGRENKIGGTILGIAAAMVLLAIVAKIVSGMDNKSLVKGVTVITVFGLIIAALIKSTSKAGEHAAKAAVTILAVAAAIGILALVSVLLGMVDTDRLAKGIVAVGLLSSMVALMVVACRGVEDIKGTLIILVVAIGILAGAVAGLSPIDTDKLASATVALSMLMGMFALMTKMTGSGKANIGSLIGLVVVVGLLAGVLWAMSELDVKASLETVGSLSILLLALSVATVILSKMNVNIKNALMGALALTAMAVPLAAFVGVLALMQGVTAAAGNVAALVVLATAMTLLLIPLTLIGAAGMSGAPYLGALALLTMAVPLVAFVGVLALMQNVQNAMSNVMALTVLATAMTLLLIPLTLIGAAGMAGLPYLGVLALLAMAVPMVAFVGVLALMQNIQNAEANANLLINLMTTMSDVLFKISLVAPLAVIGVAALSALSGLVVVLTGVLAALGGLSQIPGFNELIADGGETLALIGNAIGKFIGSIIGGLAEGMAASLPAIGDYLSQFITNLTPFIEGVKTVDKQLLTGVGILSAAIIALTVAEFINGITNMSPFATSLPMLGTQLSMFMHNALPFIMTAAMITPEMLSGVRALADTILILTAANVLDGLTSWLTGGNSLEHFATQLPILGQGLSAFATSIGTFTDEQLVTVNCAAKAIKTLASAAAEIPNTGGLLGQLVGENDLGMFAAQFPILGTGLSQFLTNVGTFTEDQVATVNCAADAIKSLAQASSEIPNAGGLLGQLVGENDLATFAIQFPILGSGLARFLTNVGTFTDKQVATVECAAEAIKLLAQASSEIPNSGGWLGQIVGDNDLGTFAEQFPVLGTGIAGFMTNIGTFTDEQLSTVSCAANAIKVLAQASSAIPNTGGWLASLIGDNDLGTFAEQLPAVGEGIKNFVSKLGTFTDAQVSTVYSGVAAINALSGLANADLAGAKKHLSGFGDDLPAFAEDLSAFCTGLPSSESVSSAVDSIRNIISVIEDVANANSGALATFAKDLKKIGEDAVDKFVKAFTSDATKTDLKEAAKELGSNVVDGIKDKETAIKTAGENAAKKAVSGVETQEDDMESAGKDLGSGLVKGINAKQTAAYNAGFALGQKAVQGEKDGQKSNSPSKLTIQAGKWLGEGLVIGIGQMGDKIYSAGSSLGETATKSLSSSISRISDMVSSDIDTQPTIRPVLDLSDVRTGASALSNMLNMDSSVGIGANVSAISSMMGSRGQNGANTDIVSAIDNLSKKMDGIGNTTYQVNGVTYDDGSNVATAVGTLTRAIKMERRT